MSNALLQLLRLITLVSSLQHEKSFMVDLTATNVVDIALYNRSLLVTSSSDIVQKDVETGAVQRTFLAHTDLILSLKVVNGSTMITSGWDDIIIVWDLKSGSVLRRIWLEASGTYPKSMQLVNSNLFVCGLDGKVRIVDMISGRVARTINVNDAANAIIVQDESFYVGKVGLSLQLEKYSVSTRSVKMTYVGHQNAVVSLILWEEMLFSGSVDNKAICWNEKNGQIARIYNGHTSTVRVLTIIDNFLYSGDENGAILKWIIDTGVIEKRFPGHHTNAITCFAYTNGVLFSGSIDTTVIRWHLESSTRLFTYSGRNIKLRSFVLWKNFIIACGEGIPLIIHDKAQNSLFPVDAVSGRFRGIVCMVLLHDTLFTGGTDSTIRHLSLFDYSELKIYYGHSNVLSSLALDQKYLYSSAMDKTVKRWNISSGFFEKEYVGHTDAVLDVKIREDRLYSCSYDTYVREWDKDKAKMTSFFKSRYSVLTIAIYDVFIVLGTAGLHKYSLSTGEALVKLEETFGCGTIALNSFRIYTGHSDGVIRGRDAESLIVLEYFQGHTNVIGSVWLDDAGILFSAGFDGSVKKWNMASRRVSFSYENRNGSVTALTADSGILYVGTREGLIHSFSVHDACLIRTFTYHSNAVTSLAHMDGIVYSSGLDGMVFGCPESHPSNPVLLYDAKPLSFKDMTLNLFKLITIRGDNEIVIVPRMNSSDSVRSLLSAIPLVSIAANDDLIFTGSITGSIIVMSAEYLQPSLSLEYHTSQVNYLLVAGSVLYSASNDKTIIKWSLERRVATVLFQRLSASSLGHLGPVNSLTLCRNTLFSVGSDLTTRRWNIQTGRHEDVYFGPTKAVTTVVCLNGSVFAGSEDFSVLMYSPTLPDNDEIQTTWRTSTDSTKRVRTRVAFRLDFSNSEMSAASILIGVILAIVMLSAAVSIAYFRYLSQLRTKSIEKAPSTVQESSELSTDLNTVVNTVIGISKHATYRVENSSLATVKKLASGGGGEIFLARVMNPFLKENTGTLVIQKVVFIKSSKSEEAFFQEVGILVMLSSFPHFCTIIGYTLNPMAIILKFYPDGSLADFIRSQYYGTKVAIKVSMDISQALRVMHSHYLAHCDLKPQNILVEVENGMPSCFLTDFGITQILSEKIIASKAFNIINVRGLSVHFASPEAFANFRSKNHSRTDFTKYDLYSFACVMFEVITHKVPWR